MCQPVMCKFLVENGADIDEIAADISLPAFTMYGAYKHMFSLLAHHRYTYHCSMDMLMPYSYLGHRCS
jgi:hypothetical protein